MLLGWSVGDFITWKIGIQRKIRILSKSHNLITIPSLIAFNEPRLQILSKIAAYLCVVFLTIYMAGQFTAAGKSVQIFLNINYYYGAIGCALCISLYSSLGGIRASMWTDIFQSILMISSTLILAYFAVKKCGGFFQSFYASTKYRSQSSQIKTIFS